MGFDRRTTTDHSEAGFDQRAAQNGTHVGDGQEGWTRPRPGVAGPDETRSAPPGADARPRLPGLGLEEGFLRMGILAGRPSFDRQAAFFEQSQNNAVANAVRLGDVDGGEKHSSDVIPIPSPLPSTLPPAGSSVQAAAGPSSDALKKKNRLITAQRPDTELLPFGWPVSL